MTSPSLETRLAKMLLCLPHQTAALSCIIVPVPVCKNHFFRRHGISLVAGAAAARVLPYSGVLSTTSCLLAGSACRPSVDVWLYVYTIVECLQCCV